MPPPSIKTVRDIIYYQFAKIISESSGFGKTNYGMIMAKWKQLVSGEIQWSTSVSCIPLGMLRSVEQQYPHPPRIPLGMHPNINK